MRGWLSTIGLSLSGWLAALRSLSDNPVRAYLLLARRRRKTPFWLRVELARIPLLVAAGLLAVVYVSDLLVTGGAFGARLEQAARTTHVAYVDYLSPWIGIPIVIWWLQVLYVWARDSLAVFSKDSKDPLALPEGSELALISRESIVAGALSVLLPPVALSVVGVTLAGYTVIPWGDTANVITITTGELTSKHPLSLFPFAVAGFISICVFGSLVTCLLTLAFLIAGRGIRDSASCTVCATLIALQQPLATLAVNASYWWCVSAYELNANISHLIPSLFLVAIALTLIWSVVLDWLAGAGRAKPIVLRVALFALLILHGLAPAALREYTFVFGEARLIQMLLPYLWIQAFAILVNPMAVPDLRGLLGESFDYYGSAVHFPPAIWTAYSPVMLLVLVLLSLYALRRATRQVDRWRCTER
jgi:hypothetical protein